MRLGYSTGTTTRWGDVIHSGLLNRLHRGNAWWILLRRIRRPVIALRCSVLWEVRKPDADLVLELQAGDTPSLVLVQGENRIRVDLSNVKGLVAALTDAAADLAEVLAAGGVYHA